MSNVEEIVDFISVSVYDTENTASNGGVSMTSKEAIIAGLKATGTTQAEAATRLSLIHIYLGKSGIPDDWGRTR